MHHLHHHQIWVLISIVSVATATEKDVYMETRRQAILTERSMRLGSQQNLNAKEEKLNERLMSWKEREIQQSLWEGKPFAPELHFFKSRPLMERSPIFSFIRSMPKGANLHNHFGATVPLDWFVSNVTYRAQCYVCRTKEGGYPLFHFFRIPPNNPDCPWRLVAEERAKYDDPLLYDAHLEREISVVVDDPDVAYPSIRAVWQRFEPYFIGVLGAVNYLPVFGDYLWQTLEEFHEDGIQYTEIRFTIELYDLEGSYSDEFMVETILEIVEKFKQQHPDFIDAKVIIASIKGKTLKQQEDAILSTTSLCEKYPDDVLGFDLIQHEDTAPSLLQLLHLLRHPSLQNPPRRLPFFFHAGETAWTELTDENLIDAILLNTSRIGHGYALLRHPWVLQQIQKKGIAIEINPISNQVLKLVTDLRNHPGSVFMSLNLPMVVSSDDPAVWGSTPLTHDFYVTFMALASAKDDLRVLKQLAINSIKYSAVKPAQKEAALVKWQNSYDQFIDKWYQSQFA